MPIQRLATKKPRYGGEESRAKAKRTEPVVGGCEPTGLFPAHRASMYSEHRVLAVLANERQVGRLDLMNQSLISHGLPVQNNKRAALRS